MSGVYKGFEPKWFRDKFSPKSYRSIFKWGGYDEIKLPKETCYQRRRALRPKG